MSKLSTLAIECEKSQNEERQEAPKKRSKRKNRSELEKLNGMDMGPAGGGLAGDMVARVGQRHRERVLARDSLKEIEEELGEPKRKYKRTGRGRKTGVPVVPAVPERPEVPEVPEIPAKARKVRAKFGFMASEIQELKEASEHPWEKLKPAIPEIEKILNAKDAPELVEEPKTTPELENAPQDQDEQGSEQTKDAQKMLQEPVVLVEEPMEVTQELQIAPEIQKIQNEDAPEILPNWKMISEDPQNASEPRDQELTVPVPELQGAQESEDRRAPNLEDDIQKHPTPIVLKEQAQDPELQKLTSELQDAPEVEATDAPNALCSELQCSRNQEPDLQNAPELLVSELQKDQEQKNQKQTSEVRAPTLQDVLEEQAQEPELQKLQDQDVQKLSGELQKDQEPTSELTPTAPELQDVLKEPAQDPKLQKLSAELLKDQEQKDQESNSELQDRELQDLRAELQKDQEPTSELTAEPSAPIAELQDAPANQNPQELEQEPLSVTAPMMVSPKNQDALQDENQIHPELQKAQQSEQELLAAKVPKFTALISTIVIKTSQEVHKLLQETPAPAPPTKELEVLNKKAQKLGAPIVESSNNQDAPAILQDLEHASEALSIKVVSPANQDAPELQNDVQKLQEAPTPPTKELEVLNKKAQNLGAPIAPNGLSLVLHDAQDAQKSPEKDAQLDVLPSMLSPPALPAPELQNELSFTEVLTMEWQDTSAPGAQEPGAQEPGAQEPGAQEPGAQEPGAQEPGAPAPGAQEPGAPEPVGAGPELAEPRAPRVAQIKEEVITISDDEEEEQQQQRPQVFPMGYMPLFPFHMANVLQGYFNPIPMPIYPMMYPRGL